MLLLLGFAFLAGLVTILAPCIWPILPVVLSSSVAGTGHRRPLGITLGLMASFAVFTLSISSLVRIFHFDPENLRYAAMAIIGLLGLAMVIPRLSIILESWISRLSGSLGGRAEQGSGFLAGLVTGASLGVVWSPCAGPILAAIATLAATGQVTVAAVLVTMAYVAGVGVPLLALGYGGRRLVTRTRFLSRYTGRIQQAFGLVMLLSAAAIFTGYDRVVETGLLDAFPAFSRTFNQFESNRAVSAQLDLLKGRQGAAMVPARQEMSSLNTNAAAPELTGITKWLNTDAPLSLKALRGKVVLVDFWTYTCINCLRTLPHVTSWYEKYKDDGFVVIGVHTPEFQFEHDTKNVLAALDRYHIHYPVAQDNDYRTWNAFDNRYWPAEYLIDAQGNVRRTHFGEGEYDQMEAAIRELLRENGHAVSGSAGTLPDQTPVDTQSPETYLGASRMEYFAGGGTTGIGERSFSLPEGLRRNAFSFGGTWNVKKEYAVAGKGALLEYRFQAKKVFLVLRPGPSGGSKSVTVLLDGRPVDSSRAGTDVMEGTVAVNSARLYNLIDLKGMAGDHVLLLKFNDPGVEAFAFTFGS